MHVTANGRDFILEVDLGTSEFYIDSDNCTGCTKNVSGFTSARPPVAVHQFQSIETNGANGGFYTDLYTNATITIGSVTLLSDVNSVTDECITNSMLNTYRCGLPLSGIVGLNGARGTSWVSKYIKMMHKSQWAMHGCTYNGSLLSGGHIYAGTVPAPVSWMNYSANPGYFISKLTIGSYVISGTFEGPNGTVWPTSADSDFDSGQTGNVLPFDFYEPIAYVLQEYDALFVRAFGTISAALFPHMEYVSTDYYQVSDEWNRQRDWAQPNPPHIGFNYTSRAAVNALPSFVYELVDGDGKNPITITVPPVGAYLMEHSNNRMLPALYFAKLNCGVVFGWLFWSRLAFVTDEDTHRIGFAAIPAGGCPGDLWPQSTVSGGSQT